MAMGLIVAVLERGPARASDALVLLAIADSADKSSGEAWPAVRNLARAARLTERGVQKVVSRLCSEGWLTVEERQRSNGSQASNLYRINLSKLGEAGPGPSVSGPAAAARPVDKWGERRSPSPERRSPPPPNVVHPRGANVVHPLNLTPHIEPCADVSARRAQAAALGLPVLIDGVWVREGAVK